jgi:hypothetical protein
LITGEEEWRDALGIEVWYSSRQIAQRGVRVRDAVYFETYAGGQPQGVELYDLTLDPYQLDSRADDPAYAGLLDDLRARLELLIPLQDWPTEAGW